MGIPRPDFVFRPDRSPTPCDVCRNAIEDWNVTTYVGPVPVISICADCVIAVFKAVIATPTALQSIDPQERNQLGRALRTSATKDAERDFVERGGNVIPIGARS